MDANRFDQIVHSLTHLLSRRMVLGVTLGGVALPTLAQPAMEAKKRRKRKGKKGKTQACSTDCDGEVCGDGCCGECQQCFSNRPICVVESGSTGTLCSGGECCGGACCPPSCQCGLPGVLPGLDTAIARYYALSIPFCNAIGTGQLFCPDDPCPAGTECVTFHFETMGEIGACVGLCPDVNYPPFQANTA